MKMAKQIFRSQDLNGQSISEVNSIELLNDASQASEAVRLSQSQQISADAVQAKLVSDASNASTDTAFTSATMTGFLSGKQDNMEIDAASSAYLAIEDGYKIKVKQLLITDVKVDVTHGTLTEYLNANSGETKQEGDIIILNAAIDNQERSWIKTGSASQGVDGYTRLQTDYNVSSIRAMFSAGGFLNYSASTGQYEVNLGTDSAELGGQTLPHGATFTTIAPASNTASALEKLEILINAVEEAGADGTSAVTTRINNLTGVNGANLGSFGGRLPNDSSVKQVLSAVESDLTQQESNLNTEATLRSDADTAINTRIDNEVTDRQNADTAVTQASINRDNTLQSNIDSTNLALTNETSRAVASENALDSRLDIVEGSATTNGSIAKAQADAQAFTLASVASEAAIRGAVDSNLQMQIDAISAAFLYKGYVNAEGRIVHIDPFHANHNVLFENAALFNGDFYKVNADITITFGDASTIEVNTGDGLLAINDVASGSSSASDIHKTDNTESADLIREGMLDGVTIEKSGGNVKVVDDSIGRDQLAADVETDIDNKVLKSGDTMTGALKVDKTVTAGTGYTGGYDYSAHFKMKSIDTDSLTDTQRALLVENEVYTGGSGNPLDLDYANAATITSHYKGSSNDMTVAVVGLNGEGRVLNASAAVYATGSYGVATDAQLGVNAGGTFVAQNAATANLGIFGFSDTAGALNNRAAYFALSTDALDFDSYRVARVASPLPVQDAAVIIDDYTGVKHALFVNGKSEFQGKVIVPSSTADNEAVNGADIKAKQKIYQFDLSDGVAKVISTPAGVDLDKVIWRVVDNYTDVDLSVVLDDSQKQITVTATGGNLSDVKLLIQELSCDVENV